jgi:hypothetical protein
MNFVTSLTIWGAAYSDDAYEQDAVLAESGEGPWDHDEGYLESLELHVAGERKATPLYWALPAVALLLILQPELHPSTFEPAND